MIKKHNITKILKITKKKILHPTSSRCRHLEGVSVS